MNDIELSPLFNCANDLDINIGMSKNIKINQEICDKHAPIKTKFINKVQMPILNSKWRKESIKKSMIQHRYNKKRDCLNKDLLCVDGTPLTSLPRKSISKYFKERCNKNSTQKQRFWQTTATFMKNSSDTVIQDIVLIEDGNFIRDTEEVCDIFIQYFINIGILMVNENDNDFSACLTHIRDHCNSYYASFKFWNVYTNTVVEKTKEAKYKESNKLWWSIN